MRTYPSLRSMHATVAPSSRVDYARLCFSPSTLSKRSTLATRRNIDIIAHVDAGQTTLTERLLKISGKNSQRWRSS